MLIVAGTFKVAPQERDDFLAQRAEAVLASRAEPGCIEYTLTADPIDRAVVLLFECWESQAALDEHFRLMRARPPGAPDDRAFMITDRAIYRYPIAPEGRAIHEPPRA